MLVLVCEDRKLSTMPSGRRTRGGPRRDRDAQEQLRLRAAGLFARQVPQAQIARELGTSAKNVSRWYRRWQQNGEQALRSRGAPGRTPKVTREQRTEVEQALLSGARANGFPTDLWTLPRVAQVIQRLTGVAHHPGHVWRLLRGLGWSVQRPARRAAERDDQVVEQWVSGPRHRPQLAPDARCTSRRDRRQSGHCGFVPASVPVPPLAGRDHPHRVAPGRTSPTVLADSPLRKWCRLSATKFPASPAALEGSAGPGSRQGRSASIACAASGRLRRGFSDRGCST